MLPGKLRTSVVEKSNDQPTKIDRTMLDSGEVKEVHKSDFKILKSYPVMI